MTGPERLYQLLRELIGRGRTWRGSQHYLCSQLGVPLRTLQRWTAELRKVNKIFTRRWMDARGYQSLNIYSIVDSGGSIEGYKRPSTCTYSSTTKAQRTPYGSANQDQKPSTTQGWVNIHVRKIASTPSQPGLFETDELDERRTVSDNRHDRKVSNRSTKGSPVSRSITYWLAGRIERPPGYVVASVGRAMKKCFDMSPDLTEQGMRDVIDSLMQSGLDVSPRHYVAACGAQKPSATRRDYSKLPLWKHRPKRSSMTPERAKEVSDRSDRLVAASRSRLQTLVSRNSSPTSPGVPASTPSPATTVRTVSDSDRRYGEYLLATAPRPSIFNRFEAIGPSIDDDPWKAAGIDPPSVTDPVVLPASWSTIDRPTPERSMIRPAAEWEPRSLDEQIEHARYQEIMGVEAYRPIGSASSVVARLRAARRDSGDQA